MDKKTELKLTLAFTLIYLIFFILLAIIRRNYEFLFCIAVICLLIIVIGFYHKELHLKPLIVIGLSVLGFMHVAGGNLYFNGIRLYDIYIFQDLIRYDQIVYTFGFFIATFVGYNLLKPYLDPRIKHHPLILFILLVLIATGIGAINEILEFAAVLFLGGSKASWGLLQQCMGLGF